MKRKAPGILPGNYWLANHGWHGLIESMRKHPKAFAHIKQDRRYLTRQEIVALAERLSNRNGGSIPAYNRLKKAGHFNLLSALRNHADWFSHLEQDKLVHTLKEWIAIAKQLAVDNGGMLPLSSWMANNGYGGLAVAIRNNQRAFAHLKQKKVRVVQPIEKWVEMAERLAKKHGGTLPPPIWLRSHGYAPLYQKMIGNWKAFQHIPRRKHCHKPSEWLPVAEQVAKEHGGILPCYKWLKDNGFYGLAISLYNHPQLFAHLKQETKRGNTPKEWVPIVEKLAKENGGVLPNRRALTKQFGYQNLPRILDQHPRLFIHIKQERKGGRKAEDWVPIAEMLAKRNGGILPSAIWCKKSGYGGGLHQAIRHHPELFTHIKRKKRP